MELCKTEKIAQLEKVLQSRALQNSESLKAFLRFVVERTVNNDEAQLKEYTIATEVFGRNSDYDSRIDSVVRVQAGRLRAKLQEYYTTEGKGDKIVIDLPKGHYHPVFNHALHAPAATAPEQTPSANGHPAEAAPTQAHVEIHTSLVPASEARTWRMLPVVLSGAIAILVLAVLVLAYLNHELRRHTLAESAFNNAEEVKAVWSAFLDDPEPPLIVLSSPAVYRFTNKADPEALTQRAIKLTPEQARTMQESPEFKGQWAGGDDPRLLPSLGMYTGMGEAIGLSRLTDLFRSASREILLKQSRQVSAADLKYRNVVLLGSIYVNEWSRKLPTNEVFVHTFSATIENRDPQPGEEREYKPRHDEQTGELRVDYALITVKPNISGENAVMTLAGIYSEGTEAAAEFVTTRNHMAVLAQRLRQLGGQGAPPKYYQALLRVEAENGTPTTITLIALRPLPASGG
jgi:hypothetical protein